MSGIYGGIVSPIDFQQFTVGGLGTAFSPPAWVTPNTFLDIYLVGGGAGGCSGRRGVPGSAASGGGGGSSGLITQTTHRVDRLLLASGLTLAQLLIEPNVGIGGNGGLRVTTDNTNGNAGVGGSATSLRIRNFANTINSPVAAASGGNIGGVGSTAVAGGGVPPTLVGSISGSVGGGGLLGNGNSSSSNSTGSTGGGGGGGHPVGSWLTTSGGPAPSPAQALWGTLISGAGGGTLVAGGYNGQNAALFLPMGCPGSGGGGGASVATGAAGDGGNGSRGGGGGGGGAQGNGNLIIGGNGGRGGDGYILLTWRGR